MVVKKKTFIHFITVIFLLNIHSCSSYQQFKYMAEEFEIPAKVFPADYNQAWQAVLVVMRDKDIETKNQEAGILKTRWIDNTMELNFADSFGGKDTVKTAKYKLIINVIKGFRGVREVSRITVFKKQLIERDFLQGWKALPTDKIQEETILYRIGRVLKIEKKLKKIEELKSDEAEEEFE